MTVIDTRDGGGVLQPLTGELIPVGDVARLAAAVQGIREYRDQLNDALAAFTAALAQESQRQGTKTLSAAGLRVEVSADSEVEWDMDVLEGLRAAGLPEDRYDALVRATVSYKVDGRVARQLAGSNEAYAAIIEQAKVRVPKRQYVSVKSA